MASYHLVLLRVFDHSQLKGKGTTWSIWLALHLIFIVFYVLCFILLLILSHCRILIFLKGVLSLDDRQVPGASPPRRLSACTVSRVCVCNMSVHLLQQTFLLCAEVEPERSMPDNR